jgi:hypothetical protein
MFMLGCSYHNRKGLMKVHCKLFIMTLFRHDDNTNHISSYRKAQDIANLQRSIHVMVNSTATTYQISMECIEQNSNSVIP